MSRLRSSNAGLAALLGIFFLSLYLLTGSSDLLHNGDTDLRFQTTQAIVDRGRLWLANPDYTDSRVALGLGHHLYAFYAPGQIILMMPLYVAGKVIAHHLSLPYGTTTLYAARSLDLFLGAALAVVFFWFALVAGYGRRVAAVLTLVFGAATVAWPDAQSALEQTQVNLLLLLAVVSLTKFSGTGGRRATASRARPTLWSRPTLWTRPMLWARHTLRARHTPTGMPWNQMAAGCGVGAAILTRYDAALYLPLFALYFVYVRWRRHEVRRALGDLVAFGVATLPFLAAVGAWNTVRFGSPFITGLHQQTLGNPFFLGLAELLVSPGKGLLWYLPLVLLLPWAAPRFFRRQGDLALLCAALVLLPLLFYANVEYWHGDPSWGPRYLYVSVPYLILPLGEIPRRWRTRGLPLRAFAVLLVAISLGLEVSAVSVTQWRFWYRLQAMQQQSANAQTWTGRPFRWGAAHYNYYWNVRQSPILIQADDLYQVARLTLGDTRYHLSGKPDPFVSSDTALIYPVNAFAFWWVDPLHPLLGQRTRDLLAGLLGLTVLASLVAIVAALRRPWSPDATRIPEPSGLSEPVPRQL